jgi:transcriptional regulator with XRE-family HTH domain
VSLRNRLKRQLRNRQFRHAYADEQLNLSISTQIKVIREKQKMSQAALGAKIGTKQAGISRIESANYDSWSIATLRSLAEAFDLRLRVSFEEFGTLWKEIDDFNRESLERREFDDDPEFEESSATTQAGASMNSNVIPIDATLYWHATKAAISQTDPHQRQERIPVGAAESASTQELHA